MGEFQIAYGDTLRVLQPTLLNPDGSVHDLTPAVTVTLHLRLRDRITVIERPMVVVDPPTAGQVKYAWAPGDWAELGSGLVLMKYVVTGAAGAQLSFPNTTDYDVLRIAPRWS